ncbi:MAG: hypothetical protein HYV47_01110 [Candidatus Nealsonbacteria bacterium]|nr:hypothetical protein [Candidatus Nealsonbacteria bacterium]
MFWLLLTILAYFFLAIVSLFDRYFLVGSIPSPRIYTFNVVILWFLVGILLIPFGINLPAVSIILVGLASGLIRALAILFLTEGIIRSEVSRIVPAVSGFLPIFAFIFFFLYFPITEIVNLYQIIAFVLLVSGSIVISFSKFTKEFIHFKTLKYPFFSALLFALSFLITKILFMKTDFLTGFFLTSIGGVIFLGSMLVTPSFRKEIFTQKVTQKISGLFIFGQIIGGLGVFAQYYAIFLAKPGQVPIINALEGTRHLFLLFFVFLLFRWKPLLLKEEMGGMALFQKITGVLFIVSGLVLLAFK